MMSNSGFGGGGSGGGAGGGGSTAAAADFDVKEEFGDGGGGGGQGAMAMSSMQTGAGGSGATATGPKRYIDEDPSLPFKTRGFYMTLIMDHRKIPNLIAELSASEKSAWPIEIVRVQYVRLHEDDADGRGTGGGYNPSTTGSEMTSGSGAAGSGDNTFGATAAPTFSIEGNAGGGAGGATSQGQTAIAALKNAVQDPNMARVAICGIISLYREPPADAVVAPVNIPPATPAVPQTQPSDAVTSVSEADATAAATTDAKPSAPAEGEPAAPENNSPPTPEATPKKDEPPSASPETKPVDQP